MADNDSNSIGWFLAGLGLGALVGVLYAPKSGKETRDTIVQGAMEGRDYIVNRGRQAGDQVGQWVDKGREVYSRQKEQFSSAVEAGKQGYCEAVSETGFKGKGKRTRKRTAPLYYGFYRFSQHRTGHIP